MSEVVLFHSVLGRRHGVDDAAARLRAAGHDVHTPDLFLGRVFDDYPAAFEHLASIGGPIGVLDRVRAATAAVPPGVVYAGFSLGCVPAQLLAATEPGAKGALLLHGGMPLEPLGLAAWPAQVPVQAHNGLDDPFREQAELDGFERAARASGAAVEMYDYPVRGHLFSDASLADEYDAAAAALMFERVLDFLRRADAG